MGGYKTSFVTVYNHLAFISLPRYITFTEPEGSTLRKRVDFKGSESVCSERASEEVEQHALITEESEEVGNVTYFTY